MESPGLLFHEKAMRFSFHTKLDHMSFLDYVTRQVPCLGLAR